MSTRPGCFPEITCEQLAVFHKARELERRDAEIVFLTYPALSEEAGRKLPKPVERSLLSDLTLSYLDAREKNRRWAEEKVRQDPDSPALYLFTRWWEAVRDTHEARRMVTLTMDQPEEAFWEAVALYDAAREEEHARFMHSRIHASSPRPAAMARGGDRARSCATTHTRNHSFLSSSRVSV